MLKKLVPASIRNRLPRWLKQLVWFLFPPKFTAMRKETWLFLMRRFRQPSNLALEKVGSGYGGWTIPVSWVNEAWICYCAGCGEDISFDLGLIERFGCPVYGFDPTPRSIQFVQQETMGNDHYHFYPYGLWSSDTQMKFFEPSNPAHVSHSILNLRDSENYFLADCRSLATIMRELGHDHIDLLKMDIEGAEYAVLDTIIHEKLNIRVLCVEFDQPDSIWNWNGIRTFFMPLMLVWRLRRNGYQLVVTDHLNYTFIHQSD